MFTQKILRYFSPSYRNRKQYFYTREEYYLTLFNQYNYLNYYLNNPQIEKVKLITEQEIKFKGKSDFGITKKKIITDIGRPHFLYNDTDIRGHSVLMYKFFLGNYKIKAEVHFFNDIFFLGSYFFEIKNNIEKQKLINAILYKYSISDTDFNTDKHQIIDPSNNYINIVDNIYFTIAYHSGDSKNMERIIKIVNAKKRQLEKQANKIEDYLIKNL